MFALFLSPSGRTASICRTEGGQAHLAHLERQFCATIGGEDKGRNYEQPISRLPSVLVGLYSTESEARAAADRDCTERFQADMDVIAAEFCRERAA